MPRQARTISATSIYHAILRSVNKQQVFVDETYIGSAEYEKSTEYYHLLRVSGTCPSDPDLNPKNQNAL